MSWFPVCCTFLTPGYVCFLIDLVDSIPLQRGLAPSLNVVAYIHFNLFATISLHARGQSCLWILPEWTQWSGVARSRRSLRTTVAARLGILVTIVIGLGEC